MREREREREEERESGRGRERQRGKEAFVCVGGGAGGRRGIQVLLVNKESQQP